METGFQKKLEQKITAINQEILAFLPAEEGYQKTLFQAVHYSIEAGGKRLRPLLMQECFLLFSEKDPYREIMSLCLGRYMAAIEMIHTYSLVHDDLPAMDNDLYRRGKLTTHAKYGEAMAVLAGDGLQNLAFETAAKAYLHIRTPECLLYQRLFKALDLLGSKSGIYGMAGGQAVDVEKSGNASDENELQFIYQMKTSALFEAAMGIGAVLGGAGEEETAHLIKAAGYIGLAFQIQDDILDVAGNEALIGKPLHSDAKNKKTTYVSLQGMEAAKAESERLTKSARDILDTLFQNRGNQEERDFLYSVLQNLTHRTM